MSTYGFRIHTIHPHVRRTQTFLEIDDVSDASSEKDALDAVYSELLAIQNVTNVGSPTFFQDDEVEDRRKADNDKANDLPYFTVLNVHKSGRVLTVLVETGREADHDALVSRDGKHEDIKRKAAVRRSNVVIRFPLKGEAAIMISEVRGRSYAGDLLIAWMTRTAQRAVVGVDAKGNRSEEPWLNWKLIPRIDGERLDGILAGSSEHTLKLRRKTVTPQGTPSSYDVELTQIGLKQTKIETVLTVLTNMAQRRSKGSESDRRKQAAKDVLTLVEPNVAKVGGVEFDDGEIAFLERGKKQTINSESIDQLFVYPLTAKRPSADELIDNSEVVVARIAMGLKLPLQ